MQHELSSGWTVSAVGGAVPAALVGVAVPAAVPGCVHLDLQAAGHIEDPFLDQNEALAQWVARVDWQYRCAFDWVCADGEVDLVAMGLDTVALVELNGAAVAETANMHRSYRFPVADVLRAGRNDLVVTFAAPLTAAEEASERLGPRPRTVEAPINAVRKMACNFGADWGPELTTAGIWRPLRLETWHRARIGSVRPLVDVQGSTGVLVAHVDLQRSEHTGPLQVEVHVAGQRTRTVAPADVSSVSVTTTVADADLWWPAGEGPQSLYPVEVRLLDGDTELDRWEHRVGFRTVHVETAPDAHGTPFAFSVNGRPLFIRGVNWIPNHPFPSSVTRLQYAERLGQARDLHANLVRVWGGGIYEDDHFYDLCDELGLLVWQDFMFNCACYAEEEPLRAEIVAEARQAVTRLARHPSLALWNGCNENLWGYEDWGWQEPLAGRTWGAAYYFDLLPGIVAELDPGRAYLPGSPYSFSPDRHPLDPAHGTMHIWDVWNTRDYTAYRDYVPRFASEFGFQGPPTWATLTDAVHDDPLAPDSAGVLAHEKAIDGIGKLERGLKGHLPDPQTFADWHWATALNQARAVAFGVQHFRSWRPVCMGTVVWQLNDCWPVISWSAVDGGGRRKPLWYSLRRSYRPRLLSVQPRDGALALVAVNDAGEPWTAQVHVSRRSFDGTVRAEAGVSVDVGPRSSSTSVLPSEIGDPGDPSAELVLAETGDERAWWFFTEDVDAALTDPQLDVQVDRVTGGYRVDVVAGRLTRDLALLADRLAADAEVDDMLVTLLPGESASFHVSTTADLTAEQIRDPLVLRSANQLVVR